VGKTTTCINLAAASAQAGSRVLLFDADPLSAIGAALNLGGHSQRQSLRQAGIDLPGILISDIIPGLDLISPYEEGTCSDKELGEVLELISEASGEHYGCLIVDTPPFMGADPVRLLNVVDEFIVIMRAEPLAYRTLPAFLELVQRCKKPGRKVEMQGILLTLPEGEPIGGRWECELRGRFGSRILPQVIPFDEEVGRALLACQIVSLYNPDSSASTQYLSLAEHLELNRQPALVGAGIAGTPLMALAASYQAQVEEARREPASQPPGRAQPAPGSASGSPAPSRDPGVETTKVVRLKERKAPPQTTVDTIPVDTLPIRKETESTGDDRGATAAGVEPDQLGSGPARELVTEEPDLPLHNDLPELDLPAHPHNPVILPEEPPLEADMKPITPSDHLAPRPSARPLARPRPARRGSLPPKPRQEEPGAQASPGPVLEKQIEPTPSPAKTDPPKPAPHRRAGVQDSGTPTPPAAVGGNSSAPLLIWVGMAVVGGVCLRFLPLPGFLLPIAVGLGVAGGMVLMLRLLLTPGDPAAAPQPQLRPRHPAGAGGVENKQPATPKAARRAGGSKGGSAANSNPQPEGGEEAASRSASAARSSEKRPAPATSPPPPPASRAATGGNGTNNLSARLAALASRKNRSQGVPPNNRREPPGRLDPWSGITEAPGARPPDT